MSDEDLTITEIREQLSKLVKAMLAKGLYKPEASYMLEANVDGHVYVKSGRGYGEPDYWYRFYRGNTAKVALEAAFADIADLPDPETAKLSKHMRRVADCIDCGREDGIDDAYITPLVAVKEAMAENLLTARVAE